MRIISYLPDGPIVEVDVDKVDWCNLDDVIEFARKLGSGQTVFKRRGGAYYNITHTSRVDMYQPGEVVCKITARGRITL